MASIFPSIDNIKKRKRQPTSGEWFLLNYLIENLPEDVEIYYEPYLNIDRPDIVLLQKNAGITIIEVKDWNLSSYYLNIGERHLGEWVVRKTSNSEDSLIKSPFTQVFKYKDNMFNLHINGLLEKKILNPKFYGRINVYVYFHNATQVQLHSFYQPTISYIEKALRELPGDMKKHRMFLAQKHTKIKKQRDYYAVTNDLLHKISLPKPDANLFSDEIYKEFKRILKPPFHTLEEGIDLEYSKRQIKLSQSKPVQQKIKGVAGSGKTLVLAKRAVNAHLRHSGKVLILTFNITLTSYIHDMISKVRENFSWDNFQIIHYHLFIVSVANNLGMTLDNPDDFENINLFENVKDKIEQYNTILIDEIQDYKSEWIRIIKKYFLVENGELVVFGDEKQNIYDRKLDENHKPNTTIVGAWNLLNESFRLDTHIAKLAEDFQKVFFQNKYEIDKIDTSNYKQLSLDFETHIIKLLPFNNIEGVIQKIYEFIKENQIPSNDVCILSYEVPFLREMDYQLRNKFNEKTLTTFETKEVFDLLAKKHQNAPDIFNEELKNIRRVKKVGFWLNGGTMKLSTIHSFKGWEAPTIFLVLNAKESDSQIDEAVYIAITRARQNLIVFENEKGKYFEFFKQKMN